MYPVYNLPEMTFVGGTRKPITVRLTARDSSAIDLSGCTVYMSFTDFADLSHTYAFRKTAELSESADGYFYASVTLDPADTIDLSGKYTYQFTIVQSDTIDADYQGICIIKKNIDAGIVTQ